MLPTPGRRRIAEAAQGEAPAAAAELPEAMPEVAEAGAEAPAAEVTGGEVEAEVVQ